MFSTDNRVWNWCVNFAIITKSALVSCESFAYVSTDNRFEISVSTSLLLQNLPLSVERVSRCSLQIIALKSVCQFRYCYKDAFVDQHTFKISSAASIEVFPAVRQYATLKIFAHCIIWNSSFFFEEVCTASPFAAFVHHSNYKEKIDLALLGSSRLNHNVKSGIQ